MPDVGGIIVGLIVVLAILFGLFMLLREVMCWYWKINEMVLLLRSIDQKLSANASNSVVDDPWWTRQDAGLIPSNVQCPYCRINVTLEESERTSRKFTCPNCNKAVDMNRRTQTLKCPKCGKSYAHDFAGEFCEECGAHL